MSTPLAMIFSIVLSYNMRLSSCPMSLQKQCTFFHHRLYVIVTLICIFLTVSFTDAFRPKADIIANLTGSNGFTITGLGQLFAGKPKVAVGDLNCDGIDDILTVTATGIAMFWGKHDPSSPTTRPATQISPPTDSSIGFASDVSGSVASFSFSSKYSVGEYQCQDVIFTTLGYTTYLIKARPPSSSTPFPVNFKVADADTIISSTVPFSQLLFVDLDNDGKFELVLAGQTLFVILRQPTGGFPKTINISTVQAGTNPAGVQLITIQAVSRAGGLTRADINGDGLIDFTYVDQTNVLSFLGGEPWAQLFKSLVAPFTKTLSITDIHLKSLGFVQATPGTGNIDGSAGFNALQTVDWNLDGTDDIFIGNNIANSNIPSTMTAILGSKDITPTTVNMIDMFNITKPPRYDGYDQPWTFNSAGGLMGSGNTPNHFQQPMITASCPISKTFAYLLYGTADISNIAVNSMHSCQGYELDVSSDQRDFGHQSSIGDVNGDGLNDVIWRSTTTLKVIFGTPLVLPKWIPNQNSPSPLVYTKGITNDLPIGKLLVQCTTMIAQITGNPQRGDVLSVLGVANTEFITYYSYDPITYTLTFTPDSHEYYNQTSRVILYSTTSTKPGGVKTISMSHHPYGFSDQKYINTTEWDDITVSITNDSPVIDGTGSDNVVYAYHTVDTIKVIVDNNIIIIDKDDTTLESATVTITPFTVGSNDVLICPEGYFSVDDEDDDSIKLQNNDLTCHFNDTTGVLTITGIDTIDNYQTILRKVIVEIDYEFNQDDVDENGAIDHTIIFTVNDGYIDSAPFERVIAIEPSFTIFSSKNDDDDNTMPCHLNNQLLSNIIISFGEDTILSSINITIDGDKSDLLSFREDFQLDKNLNIDIMNYSAGILTLKAVIDDDDDSILSVPAIDYLSILNQILYTGMKSTVTIQIIAIQSNNSSNVYEYTSITQASKPSTIATTTSEILGNFTIKDNTTLTKQLDINTLFTLPLHNDKDYGGYSYYVINSTSHIKQTELIFDIPTQMLKSIDQIRTTMSGKYDFVVRDVCGQETSLPFTLIVEKEPSKDQNNNTITPQPSLSMMMLITILISVIFIYF